MNINNQNPRRTKVNPYSLKRRIVTGFTLVTTIPAIIIAIFSTYFFNYGMRSWFDDKISTILEQSVIVAESYIAENVLQLRDTSLSIADDLNHMYYDLIYNPQLFVDILNKEASAHSLSEVLVFQKNPDIILAQSSLTFSLSFATIPPYLIESADKWEIVQLKSDLTKVRMLIKLRDFNDTYLLIGRLIDNKVIDHIDKTNGAAAEYNKIKNHIILLQSQFTIFFILITFILITIAIKWGALIAAKIVKPISVLISATDKVKNGDLNIQVPENNVSRETMILSVAFNQMFKQLSRQHNDLIVAQRALAWSDIARKVAHEIKNPLTPIQLAIDRINKKFLKDVTDKEMFTKYVNTIIYHIHDINSIVSEFVYFAKLPNPTLKEINIIHLLCEIIESKKILNDRIKYSFTSNLVEHKFVCDKAQIHQVMNNLMKNAEEALEDTIFPEINVALFFKDNFTIIEISDNGKGFSPELIHKATEAYFTTRAKGMGLGLAIVNKIVQEHNGSIEINNNSKTIGAQIRLVFKSNSCVLNN